MNTDYSVKDGKILSENGLPVAPRIFCDGHVCIDVENTCIGDIGFFAPKTNNSFFAFHKQFWGGIKFYAVTEKTKTLIRPQKCETLPFGFSSKGETLDHSVYIADDCIFFTFIPHCDCDIYLEFYHDYLFYPSEEKNGDIRYMGKKRVWDDFKFEDNMLLTKYTDQGTDIFVTFSSDRQLEYSMTALNPKHTLKIKGAVANEKNTVCLSFSHDKIKPFKNPEPLLKKQFERYESISKKAPILKSSHPLLNQFFALAPLYHDSLKVNTVKGAIRAQTTRYWVWGWDSITSSDAYYYWGDDEFCEEMLTFMMENCDSTDGIAHGYTRQMKCDCTAPPSAQGMYLVLLDNLRIAGGNFEKCYEFSKYIFETILKTQDKISGLCKGMSLYPDFREVILETGNDASAFNNTVCYCAARSMQNLAKAMGDYAQFEKARNFADHIEGAFKKFYSEDLGFFASSTEATTCEPRLLPSNNAIKWENDYCADLVMDKSKECVKFYEENLLCKAGIRPMPLWSECYDADANQLSCWWPVMSEFFIRICNKENRKDLIDRYIKYVEYWSLRLMCPEGIPCNDETPNVPFDNWNCFCGIWHAYSVRGFYNAILHGYVGVNINQNGINFHPYEGEEVSVLGLNYGKRKFDINIKGSGTKIKNVTLNGNDFGAVNLIEFKDLGDNNIITVTRG